MNLAIGVAPHVGQGGMTRRLRGKSDWHSCPHIISYTFGVAIGFGFGLALKHSPCVMGKTLYFRSKHRLPRVG